MRRSRFILVASGLATFGVLGWAAGCGNYYNDPSHLVKSPGDADAGAGSGGDDGGTPPPACIGDPTVDPTLVNPTCGVFVRADANGTGDGTLEMPFASLQQAVSTAADAGKWVFACTSKPFAENVTIAKAVKVYGGFDCTTDPKNWVWKQDTKTDLNGSANNVALKIANSAKSATIDNFKITAAASDMSIKGGSSIAMVVDSTTAELTRCDLTAQDATPGENGTNAPSMPAPAPTKVSNNDGKAACSGMSQAPGGDEFLNNCGKNAISTGGLGGGSTQTVGNSGNPGTAMPSKASPAAAGLGDTPCGNKGAGANGADGDPGDSGGPGTGIGTLDIDKGWLGVSGQAGTAGNPGQGGGGGGGKAGSNGSACSGKAGAGATGGSGGAGGCGGQPGTGGSAGGSSIALVSINATVTLTDCALLAGRGGPGGKGGNAQSGSSGGMPGTGGKGSQFGLQDACDGGKGGQGGNGGPGGGGAGGHSLAIAYSMNKPTAAGKTTLMSGMAGSAGPGGSVGNTNAMSGDPGMAPADATLLFP